MAYDASNKGDQQQQVASSTPLSQGQAAPAQQTPSDSGASAPSQPATIQAGANTAQQAAGQAQTSQNKSQGGKASSGMFTNIQKYAQANQQGGAKIAGAVQQNLQNQAKQGQVKLQNVANQFQQGMDKASGRAATEQGRQQAIQDVRAFTEREAGINPEAQLQNFDENTFRDVLNTNYSGIESIRETQSYQDARSQFDKLQRNMAMAQDPNQTQGVLKNVFARPGRQYTAGAANLDALLYNTSDSANQIKQSGAFKDLAKTSQNAMSEAELAASGLLGQRKEALDVLRNKAQETFSDVARTRSGDIENRLTGVETDWDSMANYFKDRLAGQSGEIGLSDEEARILGIGTGDQFFNLTNQDNIDKLIRSREFDRNKLISKDEQQNLARLQALSNLANLQGDRAFKTDYLAENAGQMTALDALDTENIRNQLNSAMTQFQNRAQKDFTGTGVGYDRYKSWGRSKDITEHRSATGSLDDILRDAGYQYKQAGEGNTADLDFLKSIANRNEAPKQLTGRVEDYLMGNSSIDLIRDPGLYKLGGSVLDSVGSIISGVDPTEKILDLVGLGDLSVGNLTQSFGRWFGSDKDRKRAGAAARAQQMANQNLSNLLTKELQDTGFYNRATISEADETRKQALRNMLDKLDKTNVK